jgi:heat shock protein 1/8
MASYWPANLGLKGAVGIDFGTTYSRVGVFRNDRFEIISNEDGDHATPSCVAFTSDRRLIGAAAKRQTAFNPANTVIDIKRLIGRFYDDPIVHEEGLRLPFKIIENLGNCRDDPVT